MDNQVLLYSTGNYIQYPVINHNGKDHFKKEHIGVSVVAQWVKNPTCVHEDGVRSLASLSGLRIWHCHKLRHRSQMRLEWGLLLLWL